MCALAWQPRQMCYSHHFCRACRIRRREACARCLGCAYRVALSAPKAKRVIVRDYMGSKPTLGRVALREAASASPPDTKRAMLAQSFDARAQFATQHRRRCERATCAVVARGWATSSQVGRLGRWRRGIPTHTHSWWSAQAVWWSIDQCHRHQQQRHFPQPHIGVCRVACRLGEKTLCDLICAIDLSHAASWSRVVWLGR